MSESRIWVAAVFVLSAVACGGSARVDGGAGGAGAEAGTPPGHAGAPSEPGAGGAPSPGGAPNVGGASPGGAGSPSAGSSGAGGDGSCALGDTRYPNGATWACDCNTCFCRNGSIGASAVACPLCQFGGKGHFYGETFSTDGCNTCTCGADGGVACTEKACECNPGVDGLHYVATDLNKCAAIEYECPGLTNPFQNACGCGCAQAADCPAYVNCMPGPAASDCASLRVKCPYSPIAL